MSNESTNQPGSLPRLIDVEEFFADPVFSGATISPDGTRIAYLAPKSGRMNVWVRGIDEEHEDAVCVTHDTRRGIKTHYWTGDPRWLLYLQDTDGNEDWHLYRVDLEAPEEPAVDLTPMDPGSRVFSVDRMRSTPGSVLVTMNRRPLYFDVFRVDLSSGETTLHAEQSEADGGSFLIGQDGEAAYYTALAEDGAYEFFTVDPTTGAKSLLRRLGGPEHPLGITPSLVTPDGKGLLLGAYQDSDDLRLVRIDGATGEETVVAAVAGHSLCTMGPMMAGEPPTLFTSKRTGEVIAARFVGDRPIIKVLDPHFADVYAELSALSDGVLHSVSSDTTEQVWIATFIHDREPALTYLYDHRTRQSRLLFRPYPRLDPAELAPMSSVGFPARDGLPLHAFLTLPVGIPAEKLPLVLMVHGGPWAHDSWTYNSRAQFLANRGYAVLQVNFRGSTGYGKRHITAAAGEFAGRMHDDLIDAADWAVAQGYADPARIAIFGGSYGGYATLVGVTVTPDYFAAAVDYVGMSNLANLMRTFPPFVRPHMANNWFHYVGDPADQAQEADMLARSPITMVDRIRTPLLVVHGANDVRVVPAEADNIVASLRDRGIPVEYLLAEDEGHGFQNPENLIRMYRAIEAHFAEHLGGRRNASAQR
ncbi:S9 family peptidase [Actinoalloteichus hymeniacidonis]|uniref:Dipeptidyl aminopeptidase/acylaminoacyl peptidase n=1 Tax=Actinoalloteichus hymeniacidonis TaxID=340345 RepID=A0AAC9MZD9_9PSEU|nr:S9 family peptidase [Actinoalloteichus hymeniacidonis]AOS63962.1 dipeptidyl aminopeptidase/acylaminoacyl peptidase [Actinoalloteichus hymeniacidonis]MBB5907980.1 dipeptidyl aminopeptidase/acylaminoacyl peptidase [Actinoalloteichus hymeniacidonis]